MEEQGGKKERTEQKLGNVFVRAEREREIARLHARNIYIFVDVFTLMPLYD